MKLKRRLGDAGGGIRSGFYGQMHWRAKLTDQEVELIRQLHEGGMGVTAIARKFEVSKSHVSRITRYLAR